MDVGCSGSIDTYSIIDKANYSFGELFCGIVADKAEEEFIELQEIFQEFKSRPLIWNDLEECNLDLIEFDPDGGFVKDQLIEIFSRIDILQGEYVIIKHNLEVLKENPEKYMFNLNAISNLAGSYGLEIILLANPSDFEKIKLMELEHPFLRYGIDLSDIVDYDEFFDCVFDLDNVIYYRLSALEEKFKENLEYMVNKFADTDVHLCVWSNLGKIADAIMSKKYMG